MHFMGGPLRACTRGPHPGNQTLSEGSGAGRKVCNRSFLLEGISLARRRASGGRGPTRVNSGVPSARPERIPECTPPKQPRTMCGVL